MMNLRLAGLFSLVLVVSLPLTMARSLATLICENGYIKTQKYENIATYACWSSSCDAAVPASIISFPDWNSHLLTELYAVVCEGSGKASICYKSGTSYLTTDSCSAGLEGVVTVVDDYQRRRGLRGLEEVPPTRKQCPKEVDIDGEKMVVMEECE